jgi:hypothetical protein
MIFKYIKFYSNLPYKHLNLNAILLHFGIDLKEAAGASC